MKNGVRLLYFDGSVSTNLSKQFGSVWTEVFVCAACRRFLPHFLRCLLMQQTCTSFGLWSAQFYRSTRVSASAMGYIITLVENGRPFKTFLYSDIQKTDAECLSCTVSCEFSVDSPSVLLCSWFLRGELTITPKNFFLNIEKVYIITVGCSIHHRLLGYTCACRIFSKQGSNFQTLMGFVTDFKALLK